MKYLKACMNKSNGLLYPLRHPKKWINEQPRYRSFKQRWKKASNLKDKLNAIIHLSNGWANMTCPFAVRNHKTGVWLRWEAGYKELVRDAEKNFPAGQDSFKEPRIFWLRQFTHFAGGFLLGASNLFIGFLAWTFIVLLFPFWLLGQVWTVEAASIALQIWFWSPVVICAAVTAGQAYKEFTHDRSRNPYKNYIDVLFWFLGSGAWILILL